MRLESHLKIKIMETHTEDRGVAMYDPVSVLLHDAVTPDRPMVSILRLVSRATIPGIWLICICKQKHFHFNGPHLKNKIDRKYVYVDALNVMLILQF